MSDFGESVKEILIVNKVSSSDMVLNEEVGSDTPFPGQQYHSISMLS